MVVNQLVGDEAVLDAWHVDQQAGELDDDVRRRVLQARGEFAADFAQVGGCSTAPARELLVNFIRQSRDANAARFFQSPIELLHFSCHQCPLPIWREGEALRR